MDNTAKHLRATLQNIYGQHCKTSADNNVKNLRTTLQRICRQHRKTSADNTANPMSTRQKNIFIITTLSYAIFFLLTQPLKLFVLYWQYIIHMVSIYNLGLV